MFHVLDDLYWLLFGLLFELGFCLVCFYFSWTSGSQIYYFESNEYLSLTTSSRFYCRTLLWREVRLVIIAELENFLPLKWQKQRTQKECVLTAWCSALQRYPDYP